MVEPFAEALQGGHHNSLGRTEEVVAIVVADPTRLKELFAVLAVSDELVRMRAGDALEKVCRQRPDWFVPHVDRIIDDVGASEQPSVHWHVAQILHHVRGDLSARQAWRADALLKRNLTRSTGWIVLNVTMDVLAAWAAHDPALARWLKPELERLCQDQRKSVAKRAAKRLAELAE